MNIVEMVKRIEYTMKLVGAGVVLYALVLNSNSKTKSVEQYVEACLK